MYIAAIGLTLLAIIVFVLLVQSEIEIRKKKKDEIIDTTYYFTFTEEQKCRIKKIINQFYNPEICDICNRYGGIQGGTDFTPPFKSCIGRKDLEYIKKAQE